MGRSCRGYPPRTGQRTPTHMDQDTKLAALSQLAERNADELERTFAKIRDLGELPVAFSRDALVEELGFDFTNAVSIALPTGALRA